MAVQGRRPGMPEEEKKKLKKKSDVAANSGNNQPALRDVDNGSTEPAAPRLVGTKRMSADKPESKHAKNTEPSPFNAPSPTTVNKIKDTESSNSISADVSSRVKRARTEKVEVEFLSEKLSPRKKEGKSLKKKSLGADHSDKQKKVVKEEIVVKKEEPLLEDSGPSKDSKNSTAVANSTNIKQEQVTTIPKKKVKKEENNTNDGSSLKKPKKQKIKQDNETIKQEGKSGDAVSVKPEDPVEGENDEEENDVKWWLREDTLDDDKVKWNTLSHNGVLLAPPYVPHGIPLVYNGKQLKLVPEVEEMATFFATVVGTPYAENPVFCRNFFENFLTYIARYQKSLPVKQFSKCDFTLIAEHLIAEKERKKQMTPQEKAKVKQEKAEIEERYGWAMVDGRKEKIGNYRIEPPGLFRGRGAHPKTGRLKQRVTPEQITINIGKDEPVPPPPPGHRWKAVVHNNTAAWLAFWVENVNNTSKYVQFAPTSTLKGISDLKKFEKARELKLHVHRIRESYMKMLQSDEVVQRQLATAMYLIDRFALRAGKEKGDDEADTVGCCSLRYEHIELGEKNKVTFDFLGKDSIRYYNEVVVDPLVHKNLYLFKKGKKPGDPLFNLIETGSLNKHLSSYMPGLTAKVFRTYNASHTFQEELDKTPCGSSVTIHDKVLAYNRANRQVAILCNHQRAPPKSHPQTMNRLKEKIREIKVARHEVKEALKRLYPSIIAVNPKIEEPESDLDDEYIEAYRTRELEKAALRKQNRQKKLAASGKLSDPLTSSQSDPENNTSERTCGLFAFGTMENLMKKFDALTNRIDHIQSSAIVKEENKTTALGTSKINYLDPRITSAWCAKHDVPIARIFARTLRDKFQWAMSVDPNWRF